MTDAIVYALDGFAARHGLAELAEARVRAAVGFIDRGDYDGMYKAIGKIVSYVPVALHEELVDIVSTALAFATEQMEGAGVFPPAEWEEEEGDEGDAEMVDEDVLFERLRSVVSEEQRQMDEEVSEGQRNDDALAFPTGDEFELVDNDADEVLRDESSGSPAHSELDRTAYAYNRTKSPRVLACQQCDYPAMEGFIPVEQDVGEARLLALAGVFPFRAMTRRFGTSYFATPPPHDSHSEWAGAEPEENDDAAEKRRLGAATRLQLVEAHRVQRAKERWSETDRSLLRKFVRQKAQQMRMEEALRVKKRGSHVDVGALAAALSTMADAELLKDIGRWGREEWESLAAQKGWLFGRRSGDELMCRFMNAEGPWVKDDKTPWTTAEDRALSDQVSIKHRSSGQGWVGVSAHVGNGRTPVQCLRRWRKLQDDCKRVALEDAHDSIGPPPAVASAWTAEQDSQLTAAVERLGAGNWAAIALLVANGERNGQQCMNRYMKRLQPGRRVGKWTADEIVRLKKAVGESGVGNWKRVSEAVGGRSDVQCREKWVNSLDPSVLRQKWGAAEDSLLRCSVQEHGTGRWSMVSQALNGRTATQCQRRWLTLARQGKRRAESSGQGRGGGRKRYARKSRDAGQGQTGQ